MASPSPDGNNHLSGVKAVPSDPATVWAVGSFSTPGSSIGTTNLILQRTTGGWRQPRRRLLGTADPAWERHLLAAGDDPASGRSLVLHWDGRSWTREAAPSPPAGPKLFGAAAVAPATVWGVGHRYDQAAGGNRTVTVRITNA